MRVLSLFFALLMVVGCQRKNAEPSYDFVLMTKHAVIKPAADGDFELVVDHGSIEEVMTFTKQPYRIRSYTTGKNLAKLWNPGSHQFSKSPPNAAIVMNSRAQAVRVLSMKVEENRTIFKIAPDGSGDMPIAPMEGPASIFIDHCSYTIWQLQPTCCGECIWNCSTS